MAPPSLFSRFGKSSNTRERTLSAAPRPSESSFTSRSRSPSPSRSSSKSKRPATSASTTSSVIGAPSSTTTPTLVLTTEGSESGIAPPSPGSLHRRSSMGSIHIARSRTNSPIPPVPPLPDFESGKTPPKLDTKLPEGNGTAAARSKSMHQEDLPTPKASVPAGAESLSTLGSRKNLPPAQSPATLGAAAPSSANTRSPSRPPSLNLEDVKQKLARKASDQSIGSNGRRSSITSSEAAVGTNVLVESPDVIPPSRSRANTTTDPDPQFAKLERAMSITSVASDLSSPKAKKEKKDKPWRKPSVASKKRPTGIASAIAASGMTLAHHATPQSVPPIPRMPTMNSSPPAAQRQRSRQPSASISANGGNDDDSDEGYESPDALSFNDEDIPITGFAVASSKRNVDFHELFPDVPEGDYLIEDYGCALQREILIQGRLYISENHMCFHANIFGWVTNVVIHFGDITSLEKKMTAFVIPNAIQITTIDQNQKYTFASFLSRDTTYDVIHNIWRLSHPHSPTSTNSRLQNTADGSESSSSSSSVATPPEGDDAAKRHKATQCACGREGKHFSEVALDCVIPGTPEKIYNLMFASGFIKDFMANNQKLMDIQISDWRPESSGSHLLTRNMSYIKPLNGTLGPKQTKCEIKDETLHVDFDDYACIMTTTRTPDVPSGGAFSVKTRTCMMWAGPATTRVLVTTMVEWTGRSFIKSIINFSALDGQKTYHSDLERAMRAYVIAHKTEFLPDGYVEDAAAVANKQALLAETVPATPSAVSPTADTTMKRLDAEKRGLQWALDTATSALKLTKDSFMGLVDIVGDVIAGGSIPSPWIILLVALVVSNVWTLVSLREARKRDDLTRRRPHDSGGGGRVVAEREKIANEALQAFIEGMVSKAMPTPLAEPESLGWSAEMQRIDAGLRDFELRIDKVRKRLSLAKVEAEASTAGVVKELDDLD